MTPAAWFTFSGLWLFVVAFLSVVWLYHQRQQSWTAYLGARTRNVHQRAVAELVAERHRPWRAAALAFALVVQVGSLLWGLAFLQRGAKELAMRAASAEQRIEALRYERTLIERRLEAVKP